MFLRAITLRKVSINRQQDRLLINWQFSQRNVDKLKFETKRKKKKFGVNKYFSNVQTLNSSICQNCQSGNLLATIKFRVLYEPNREQKPTQTQNSSKLKKGAKNIKHIQNSFCNAIIHSIS